MRKQLLLLAAAAGFLAAGSFFAANAATLPGSAGKNAGNYTPVETQQTGCRGGWGRCPPGRTWVCRPYGGCWCRRCW